MSTKIKIPEESQREAIVLQCLFASVAVQSPTVGEVTSFANKHGKNQSSVYQIKRVLMELEEEGFVAVETQKRGSKTWRRYHVTEMGAIKLVASTHHLPKHIRVYMADLYERVAAGASALINDYLSQGAK